MKQEEIIQGNLTAAVLLWFDPCYVSVVTEIRVAQRSPLILLLGEIFSICVD